MKNLTVRLSDLDHNRLTARAAKIGGTVSDAMRQIVADFFAEEGKKQTDKAEHEQTRAYLKNEFLILKESENKVIDGLNKLSEYVGQYVAQNQKETTK